MKVANDAWGIQPVLEVRMPVVENQRTVTTAEVHALWTDGGLRPNASNLAFLMQRVSSARELEQWKQRLKTLPVRASLLVASNELYLLQSHFNSSDELDIQSLNLEDWRTTLVSPKSHLFKPQELAKLKSGQLSLADLEETFSEGSFNFLLREQQKKIEQAFLHGIQDALRFIDTPTSSVSSRAEATGHVIRFAIAYLAARILEDKSFFNARIADPIELLDEIGKIRNGFFKRARASADYVPLEARQALTRHMGYQVSFVLADHRDVGRLYEQAIKSLKAQHEELDNENWGDLKQHYTPVTIAERMLEALPLERLRPSERVVFDPAAGSGSLLLAATSRLAAMTDISPENHGSYLRTHVIGNDWDKYASWIAQLRYFLASESLSSANEPYQISEVLPFPEIFTGLDYSGIKADIFPKKPRVIVANPPFEEREGIQKAASFVEKALSWMEEGSQFAFVLPQSFLTSTTHGVSNVRNLLLEHCQILEAWQLPEGAIGTNARQPTCVILGHAGKSEAPSFSISRKVISGKGIAEIREKGFLGHGWVVNAHSPEEFWSSITNPIPHISISTIPLGSLFYVFAGVTPKKEYPPVESCPPDTECKLSWKLSYRKKGRLWANPSNINLKKRWFRFKPEYFKSPQSKNSHFFDLSKVLVGRSVNSNSTEPLAAHFDTSKLCPDDHIFCILPAEEVGKYSKNFSPASIPQGWNNISFGQKKLWLLGILSSDLATEISLVGRNVRQITKQALCSLPLPRNVDIRIIEIVQEIIERDKANLPLSNPDELRVQLNRLVEQSYGNPVWLSVPRTGSDSGLENWKTEQNIQTKTTIGQVLEISEASNQVRMYISRLMDDDGTEGEWVPLPQELPGWALDGTPFEAELSHDIKTFEQLRERPWALRKFRHTPRPYLTDQELDEFLRSPDLEVSL